MHQKISSNTFKGKLNCYLKLGDEKSVTNYLNGLSIKVHLQNAENCLSLFKTRLKSRVKTIEI